MGGIFTGVPVSPLPPKSLGLVLAAYQLHDQAKMLKRQIEDLRERAVALGMWDEVAALLGVQSTKRRRGKPRNSHSQKRAAERAALWTEYQSEKAKTPKATDREIVRRLGGHSESATAARIAKIKAHQRNPFSTIPVAIGGRRRTRGRPKKTEIRK